MRERLGIYQNPLDNHIAKVCVDLFIFGRPFRFGIAMAETNLDIKSAVHVPVLPQGRIHPVPHSGWSAHQLAPV
jgi:hypothetical protein